ncbi:MAG: PIG-L family deacetylase [Acidobacteriota bacterium]
MRILAVGAHPDDVEFGCAPVLIQESRRGHQVRILVASKGEAASAGTPEGRAEEARAAAKIICGEQGADVDFLDLGGDCHFAATPEHGFLLAAEIRKFRPDAVLAPHLGENQHPDHSSLGRIVRDACRLARYGGLKPGSGKHLDLAALPAHQISSLYYYAITQVFIEPPQLVLDVSSAYAEWQAAMQCHGSQMKTRAYPELVTARARAWGAAIGVEYAVGLWLNDPVRVNSLAELPLSARHF